MIEIAVQENGEQPNLSKVSIVALGVLVLIWMLAGISAFVMSLICFGFSGTMPEKVIGLFLAIFFGPFYWIYFIAVKNYCN